MTGPAIEERAILQLKTRSAIQLTVPVVDNRADSLAINTMSRRDGWADGEIAAIPTGAGMQEPKLGPLLACVREAAGRQGHMEDPTWSAALGGGWSDTELDVPTELSHA